MEIQIADHAFLRAEERGASEEEIRSVLETGVSIEAKKGRLAKEKIFQFELILNKSFFEQKKIVVIYIIENTVFIVITVIVKYGIF